MIDLYTFPTPNGQKIQIALEEFGLAYEVNAVNIAKGDQFTPEFLAISPNNKIPAIVDHDGPGGGDFALAESGAILLYLAEKTGKLMPEDPRARHQAVQWLMIQMGHVGPMLGQYNHFHRYAKEKIPYALERYGTEAKRLFGVLERQLADHPYLAGDAYSVVDIATFPWVREPEKYELDPGDFPNLVRWRDGISARPAVQRGLAVLGEILEKFRNQAMTEDVQRTLFGVETPK